MSRGRKIAAGVGAVSAAALALAVPLIARNEGEVRHTYVDHVGQGGAVLSYCYGATAGAKLGQTYTHGQCLDSLQEQALKHAAAAQACLTRPVPVQSTAAFYDFAYNIGSAGFCQSSVARKANAGDVAGACRAIGLYVYSNGKDCRLALSKCAGIIKRRRDEMELCRKGLS